MDVELNINNRSLGSDIDEFSYIKEARVIQDRATMRVEVVDVNGNISQIEGEYSSGKVELNVE